MASQWILLRKTVSRALLAAALFAIMSAAVHFYFMHRAHDRERFFMRKLEASGGQAFYDTVGPDWIPMAIRGRLHAFLHISSVDLADVKSAKEFLPDLKSLSSLIHLDLSETSIQDEDLSVLQDLPRLKSLRLARTRITDAGLAHVQALKHLESLDLALTQTTPAGRNQLRRHLPKGKIQPEP